MGRLRVCLCGAVLLAALTAGLLAARPSPQLQPQQPRPQFRSGTDLVSVDVSVLDRRRVPVRGLDRTKFTVLEDGRPQPIVAFSQVEVPGADVLPTGWMRDVAPDVRTNEAAGSRLFLLVFDDAQIAMRPYVVNAAKGIGHAVVDALGPDDLAAVVFTKDNRNAMDFTSDRARLGAMVDRLHGGSSGEMSWLFNRYSTGVLRRAADYLASIRDRRKAIVYVSGGVPGAARAGGADSSLNFDLRDTIERARRGNVLIYPINPNGLVGFDFDGVAAAIREGTLSAAGAINAEWDRLAETSDHLHILAANTGGFVVERNEFASSVAQMFRENGSYYLLGFTPALPPDGKRRRLEVRVDHPDVTVHARNEYSEPKPARPGRQPPVETRAISDFLPLADLPLRAALAPFAIPGQKDAAIAVTLGLSRPAPAAPTTDNVRLLVHAFTPEGKSVRARTLDSAVALRPVEGAIAKYELHARIDLRPGRYHLRVSAHSLSQSKAGSVYAEIVVPDFAKEPVSLSGIVLTATPALPSAGAEHVMAVVPGTPTTQREFAGHSGTAFVRVYQGGKRPLASVPLTSRIVDAGGTVVFEEVDTLEPGRFGTARAAEYSQWLPIARLARGPYLLTFEAALGGQTATREMRFDVR